MIFFINWVMRIFFKVLYVQGTHVNFKDGILQETGEDCGVYSILK